MQVFLLWESKTAVAIGYKWEDRDKMIGVVPKCHPNDGFVTSNGEGVMCQTCKVVYVSNDLVAAAGDWAISWFADLERLQVEDVTDWISGWTGIPEGDLVIEVTPRS